MAHYPSSRYADLTGDGTGVIDAATLNGSSTPQILRIKPGPSESFQINRMVPSLTDGPSGLNSGGYGSGVILPNGFQVMVKRYVGLAGEFTLWDTTHGNPIRTNAAWKSLCFDENLSTYGVGDQLAAWRYTFFLDGDPITLNGANQEELQIICNDDLAARTITEHVFRVGFKIL